MSRTPTWSRSGSLRALVDGDRFDVLVVGGGIIGAAVALDASSRGLSVALVEQSDFASGSSSKSTKLLHGGIRYLPHFQFGLIREGLLEQKILAKTADYLFHPLEFVVPLFDGIGMADLPRWASNPRLLPYSLRLGLSFYDLLGRRGSNDRHRKLAADDVRTIFPALRTNGLRGGFAYQDAQTDDARLVIAVLKTAVMRHHAVAVSRIRARQVTPETEGYRVALTDTVTGDDLSVEARAVVSATWAFRPPPLQGGHPSLGVKLSKGVHVLYRSSDLQLGSSALVLPETDDSRVLFVVPWAGMALVGTTDTSFEADPANVSPNPEDIEYLARHVNRYLDIDVPDPIASFAGVRALTEPAQTTAKASREHALVSAGPGYTQIVGGKLTAYRPIAAEAVDSLMDHLGFRAQSPTATEILIGAGLPDRYQAKIRDDVAAVGADPAYGDALVDRFGIESDAIVRLLEERPELRHPLGDWHATLAEVLYMARHESVISVADFALRRTHLAWTATDHGRGDAREIASTIGGELGWSEHDVKEAVAQYGRDLANEGL